MTSLIHNTSYNEATIPDLNEHLWRVMHSMSHPDHEGGDPFSLCVSVLGASGLRAKTFNGGTNPYVVLQLGPSRHTTAVLHDTLSPRWNSELLLSLPAVAPDKRMPAAAAACSGSGRGSPLSPVFSLTVMHRRSLLTLPDKFLGVTNLRLDDIISKWIGKETWFMLHSKPGKKLKKRGYVEISFQLTGNQNIRRLPQHKPQLQSQSQSQSQSLSSCAGNPHPQPLSLIHVQSEVSTLGRPRPLPKSNTPSLPSSLMDDHFPTHCEAQSSQTHTLPACQLQPDNQVPTPTHTHILASSLPDCSHIQLDAQESGLTHTHTLASSLPDSSQLQPSSSICDSDHISWEGRSLGPPSSVLPVAREREPIQPSCEEGSGLDVGPPSVAEGPQEAAANLPNQRPGITPESDTPRPESPESVADSGDTAMSVADQTEESLLLGPCGTSSHRAATMESITENSTASQPSIDFQTLQFRNFPSGAATLRSRMWRLRYRWEASGGNSGESLRVPGGAMFWDLSPTLYPPYDSLDPKRDTLENPPGVLSRIFTCLRRQ